MKDLLCSNSTCHYSLTCIKSQLYCVLFRQKSWISVFSPTLTLDNVGLPGKMTSRAGEWETTVHWYIHFITRNKYTAGWWSGKLPLRNVLLLSTAVVPVFAVFILGQVKLTKLISWLAYKYNIYWIDESQSFHPTLRKKANECISQNAELSL